MSQLIDEGRAEGWLRLSSTAFPAWAQLNNIEMHCIKVGSVPGFDQRGSAIVAKEHISSTSSEPLMVIPKDSILSLEMVQRQAQSDPKLREVLEGFGDHAKTPRGAMMVFLFMQVIRACPHIEESAGVPGPFSEYIKFFPEELLPTLWTDEERALLKGTTLAPAVDAKLNSILREYTDLCLAIESSGWAKQCFELGLEMSFSLEDWKHIDAMYRTRALELPGIGHGMVPGLDMANHASVERTVARFDVNSDGDITLERWSENDVGAGQEITISYGDDKGACEMLFSYGFIEDDLVNARSLFLDLTIPDDDPLKQAKLYVSDVAPGVRISQVDQTSAGWESEFVWVSCVNEEDGFDFKVQRTVDGKRELKAFWKDDEIQDVKSLKARLESDQLWPVFLLRAVCIVTDRVEAQLENLLSSVSPDNHSDQVNARPRLVNLALKLKELEQALLENSLRCLYEQRNRLAEDKVVLNYLTASGDDDADGGDDFS